MQGSQMVFIETVKGTGKESKKPFTILKLHDPVTLQNADFFLREDHGLNIDQFKFKDKLAVDFGMEIQYGKPQTVIKTVTKVG
jgi:hypothetical protein